MDTKALIKKLQDLFAERNNGEKRYSKIWLSEIDLGGLYRSPGFVLRLKAAFTIKDFFEETLEIIRLIRDKANEESKYIPRVSVYDINEKAEPSDDDLLIYEEEFAFA